MKRKLKNRNTLKCVPMKSEGEPNKLNDENSNGVQDLIVKFHNYILKYLDLQRKYFDRACIFN